jgi:alpha-N-arabinofuranosidase
MELGNPSFIGKRQQHLFCTAETAIDFSAKSDNEKAGLIIFQDETHFYYLCKSLEQGKDVIQVFKGNDATKTMDLITQVFPKTNSKKIMMRIHAQGDTYRFEYAVKPNEIFEYGGSRWFYRLCLWIVCYLIGTRDEKQCVVFLFEVQRQ